MGTLDPTLLNQAIYDASQAGFTGDNLVRIVSIAAAETGGFTDFNANTSPAAQCNAGGCPTGILQIKPGYWAGTAGCSDVTDWLCAFRTAVHIIQTQGWQAWETYTKGVDQQYIPQVQQAVQNYGIPLTDVGAVIQAPSSDLSSGYTTLANNSSGSSGLDFLTNPIGAIESSFASPFETIGVFLFGLVVIIGGIMVLSSTARNTTVTLAKAGAASAA